jgi:hypothetical protein
MGSWSLLIENNVFFVLKDGVLRGFGEIEFAMSRSWASASRETFIHHINADDIIKLTWLWEFCHKNFSDCFKWQRVLEPSEKCVCGTPLAWNSRRLQKWNAFPNPSASARSCQAFCDNLEILFLQMFIESYGWNRISRSDPLSVSAS